MITDIPVGDVDAQGIIRTTGRVADVADLDTTGTIYVGEAAPDTRDTAPSWTVARLRAPEGSDAAVIDTMTGVAWVDRRALPYPADRE